MDNVYYQPPENIKMKYPSIVYALDGGRSEHADNVPYRRTKRYQVTVIDRNPDSDLPDRVWGFPACSFNRTFASENLNHWVYTLFF